MVTASRTLVQRDVRHCGAQHLRQLLQHFTTRSHPKHLAVYSIYTTAVLPPRATALSRRKHSNHISACPFELHHIKNESSRYTPTDSTSITANRRLPSTSHIIVKVIYPSNSLYFFTTGHQRHKKASIKPTRDYKCRNILTKSTDPKKICYFEMLQYFEIPQYSKILQ
ncbi:unnamed protein product [Trypanosoma congolense IL3000]|uniref:WGS project CAEQ00000000 data, annotated contig 1119 n=1 Tax=Trypanosoma congolense (strain IL3000) TaxID=1068625 RepID=F9W3W8_TRYCI|nr:unnamed protein product [Trypanosoma congolense IL3000]